jgi:hypothetical protein
MEDLTPPGEVHPQLISKRVKKTSKDTFDAVIASGLLSKMRLAVYKCLYDRGPLTGSEIDEILCRNGGRGHYHKRLSELERFEVAEVVGHKKCSITGRVVEAWDLTDKMPARIEEPPSLSLRKEIEILEKRVKRLSDVLRNRPNPDGWKKASLFLRGYRAWASHYITTTIKKDIGENSDG